MSLTNEQMNAVKCWVADGASISEVQSKLKTEFGVVMTYIDVRFLIDDLGAELVSVPDTVEQNQVDDVAVENNSTPPAVDNTQVPDDFSDDVQDNQESETFPSSTEEESTSNVKVSVSPIQRPDCVISGDVEFSDGSKAEWRIDRMGQLGVIPQTPDMNPPQSDIIEFQRQLQQLLR